MKELAGVDTDSLWTAEVRAGKRVGWVVLGVYFYEADAERAIRDRIRLTRGPHGKYRVGQYVRKAKEDCEHEHG